MKSLGRAALAATLIIIGAAGCNNDQLPPASGYASMSGTIVDAATKQPIAGAIVTVDTVLNATTDATGKFTIDKVPSGVMDYTVSAKGYPLVTSSANIEPGKPFELDLSMTAAPAHP